VNRPNVLLITTDQQRWDTIRAGGNPHIHTPNLDALAARGTLFRNAYCNSPVCMPSRQSFLSGRYPWTLNLTANGQEMPRDVMCIQHLLQRAGYHTAQIGKLHFTNIQPRDTGEVHPRYGFDTMLLAEHNAPGFRDLYDVWAEARQTGASDRIRDLGETAYWDAPAYQHPTEQFQGSMPLVFQADDELTLTAMVCDEAASFLRRRHAGNWFCHVGIFAPHNPFNPPKRFADLYDPEALPAPQMDEDDRSRTGLTEADWKRSKAHYYGMVSELDEKVGRLLAVLYETGQRDNTVVVFTSDHGDNCGDHGCGGKGGPGWDSCLRVPLIASWPGRLQEGARREELVELVDLVPTILDLCTLETPPFVQGRSFRAILEGRDDDRDKDDVFMQIGSPNGVQWMTLRSAAYKLCVSSDGTTILYDMETDPQELTDLADDPAYAQIRATMTDRLLQRIFAARPHVPRFHPYW
jgi:arylsulfatase A-like enzyme